MIASSYGIMTFPEKLYHWIQLRGMTQGAVARKSGLAASAITDMTAGKRRPYMDQAFRLARVLDVPLDYLADDSIDDVMAPEVSDDERAVIDLLRALNLDKSEALRRLASPAVQVQAQPITFDPKTPWLGHRDTTERYLREKAEERNPRVAEKPKREGLEPRKGGNGKGGDGKKESEGRK